MNSPSDEVTLAAPVAVTAPPVGPIRPVGTWVVAGVLTVATLAVWSLVSFIFLHRA